MKVSTINGVKIYHCTPGKTLPQWFDGARNVKSRKESLRYNESYRRRIDLIQDFHFPTAANTLKVSPNGEFVVACGTYKPQMKMFELSQLGMKFERHMDAEGIACEFLGEDFKKFVLLRDDRFLEFHAQYGLHHKLRVPKFGRDLCYLSASCDLLVGCASSAIPRVNLFRGEFLTPYETSLKGVNAISENKVHGLVAAAGESGTVECFDPRNGKRVAHLRIAESLARLDARAAQEVKEKQGVSTVAFGSALSMGVGTSSGHVLLYDLRAPAPILCRDHRYGLPIKRIQFQNDGTEERMLSADSKVIKIWKGSGKLMTAIEPPSSLNDVLIYRDSGIILGACESHRMHAWYIPALGSAPKWCHYLDSLTEELEESKSTSVYEDYKFVTRDQLTSWGVSELIGSEAVRAYMHGFFIDEKLYNRIKQVADPYAYERYYKQQLKRKVDETREDRIKIKDKLPKVNTAFARTLTGEGASKKQRIRNKRMKGDSKGLIDDRFKDIFVDPDMEIDQESETFKRLNKSSFNSRSKASTGQGEDDDDDDDDDVVAEDSDDPLALR